MGRVILAATPLPTIHAGLVPEPPDPVQALRTTLAQVHGCVRAAAVTTDEALRARYLAEAEDLIIDALIDS